MQIVIDIPEEIYIHLLARYKYQNTDDIGLSELDKVGVSIKNGTPIPAKHGRLVDLDNIKDQLERYGKKSVYYQLPYSPTIIEADKEVEE